MSERNANLVLSPVQRLTGRVAQILNARELVINIGELAGVKLGTKFAVLSETPLEVRDPETGDVLDRIDREKVRVETSEVRSKISICRTYRVRKVPPGPLYSPFAGFADLKRPPEVIPETLEAGSSSLPPPLGPEESYVKINDRVVQIEE